MIIAPAGYGKTTVLSEWDAADERPFIWVTFDDRHNDPAFMVGSIASALDEIEPIDGGVFEGLATPRPSIRKVVVPRLVESLRGRERPFVLVLDDLQSLEDSVSLHSVTAMAEHMPSGSQLALATRSEPPIGLGRLRTHRRLVELHAHDLVMTRSEASHLLEAAGFELGSAAVKRLIERTEGWPAALYLATLALEGEPDPQHAIERFAGDDRLVADYLRDEFLSRQPADDLDFLTATSLLDRLTGPLCDAVLEREGSGETLRRLSRSNLLLVPLDRTDEQFRYHALLREMLESELHRLGEGRESGLHARASKWYAEQGDFDHAIPHAISAGDIHEAGWLIWANTVDYETHGRSSTLRRWLDQFTDEQLVSSPALCLALATNHVTRGEGHQVERWTSAAVGSLENVSQSKRGALEVNAALLRAAGAARDGVVRMGEDAARAYEALPEDSQWRSLCRFLEGTAHHLVGERRRARSALEEGSRRGGVAAPNVQTVCLAQLGLLAIDENDSGAAAAAVTQATTSIDRFGLGDYPMEALVFAVSALVRATSGRIEDANRDVKHSTRLLRLLTELSPWYEAETRIVLARALLALDDVAAARDHLADAARYLHQTPDAVVLQEWLEVALRETESAASVDGRWPLTTAELRLLHFLPTHLSFREIAEQLFVSTNTVKTQAQASYRKLGVSSRAEAVACAGAAGLIRNGEAAHQQPSR
ncbi:MAG: LuxR C-terminal-related transcriptional regulator [Actinomycetota bacterium]